MSWLAWLLWMAASPTLVWDGPGATHLGAPSADGRWLTGIDPDTRDLTIRDLRTGAMRRLTNKPAGSREFAYFSAISRDSKTVAYAWFNAQGFYDLRLIPVAGGVPRVLHSNEEAGFVQPTAFTPDGKQVLTLLFRRDNISQITLIDTESGAVKVLKSLNWVYPKRMDISPDGKWIVYDNFARDGAAERDLYLLSTAGSTESKLVDSPGDDVFPVFSLDGQRVYYSAARGSDPAGLWCVALSDRKPQLIQPNLGRFLPLGLTTASDLFYAARTAGSRIYLAEIDAASGSIGGAPQPVGEGWSAEWSPGGDEVAWLGRREGENFGVDSRFVALRRADGKVTVFEPHLAHMERVAWAGGRLLISGSDGKGRGGVFALNPATAKPQPVIQDHDAPYRGYSTAAGYIAQGKQIIHDGKAVASYRSEITALAVSGGGKLAAVTGEGLWMGDRLLPGRTPSAVAWTPDGAYVLAAEGAAVFAIDSKTGDARRLFEAPAEIESLSLHPDGKRLLYSAGKARTEIRSIRP